MSHKYNFEFQLLLSVNHEWVNGSIILPIYSQNEVMAETVAKHLVKTLGFDSVRLIK